MKQSAGPFLIQPGIYKGSNYQNVFGNRRGTVEINQLIESWEIHNRINLYLLNVIAEEDLDNVLASKGRSVGEQFAHIHNVRLMWAKSAAPKLLDGLEKIEKEQAGEKARLTNGLIQSGKAMVEIFKISETNGGKVKGFKPHVVAFFGYLVSHESHHRGQIALALKQSGHPLDKKTQYAIWEWGVR